MELNPEMQTLLQTVKRSPRPFQGMPQLIGRSRDHVEVLISELSAEGFLRVRGPSNQNATLGLDIEEIELTARGYQAAA